MLPDFFLNIPVERSIKKIFGKKDKTSSQEKGGNDLAQLFEQIKGDCNEEVVSTIDAVYQFNIADEGPWYLDLKSGSGRLYIGEK